jgi:hypothetical protein
VTAGGLYLALATFDLHVTNLAGPGDACHVSGTLVVNGVTQARAATLFLDGPSESTRSTVSQIWTITPSTGHVVKLQGTRTDTGNGGSATAFAAHTNLTLLRLA